MFVVLFQVSFDTHHGLFFIASRWFRLSRSPGDEHMQIQHVSFSLSLDMPACTKSMLSTIFHVLAPSTCRENHLAQNSKSRTLIEATQKRQAKSIFPEKMSHQIQDLCMCIYIYTHTHVFVFVYDRERERERERESDRDREREGGPRFWSTNTIKECWRNFVPVGHASTETLIREIENVRVDNCGFHTRSSNTGVMS